MVFDTNFLDENNDLRSAIEQLRNLLSHSKAVLLGAGASFCAGLPLTDQLTKNLLESESLSDDAKGILNCIKNAFDKSGSPSHIEDYLSELVDWLAISSRRTGENSTESQVSIGDMAVTNQQLINAISDIKKAISEQIKKEVNPEFHKRFVSALHTPIRPGKNNLNGCIDYIVMNYDTLIEDALALSKLRYADGLTGGETGWWDPVTFESREVKARVLKLHGSINWIECPESRMPMRIASHLRHDEDSNSQIMIWPASTKYRETQLDPYADLMCQARKVLNPKNGTQRVLMVIGYSFGDSHINLEIERGLKASRGNLTVIVFTSEDNPKGILNSWYEDKNINEQVLIFAKKGFFHADQKITCKNDAEWWKFENLTEILEGDFQA
jgi:hypothetical protein